MIPIVDIYESFSGEGWFKGKRTLIVRFAGCNLRCKYCDSTYTFDTTKFKSYDEKFLAEKLVDIMINNNLYNIMITGGEPLLYIKQLDKLLDYIHDYIREIDETKIPYFTIETNGSINIDIEKYLGHLIDFAIDIKTPVSGNPSSVKIIKRWTEDDVFSIFKVIYENRDDLEWIEDNFLKTGILDGRDVYFSHINREKDHNKIPKIYIEQILEFDRQYDAYIYIDCQMHKLVDWGNDELGSLLYKLDE